MIPKNIIQEKDLVLASALMVVEGVENNSRKFDAIVNLNGVLHRLAPKRLISKAFDMATGDPLPVSVFSGGIESNRFLRKMGIAVEPKA